MLQVLYLVPDFYNVFQKLPQLLRPLRLATRSLIFGPGLAQMHRQNLWASHITNVILPRKCEARDAQAFLLSNLSCTLRLIRLQIWNNRTVEQSPKKCSCLRTVATKKIKYFLVVYKYLG